MLRAFIVYALLRASNVYALRLPTQPVALRCNRRAALVSTVWSYAVLGYSPKTLFGPVAAYTRANLHELSAHRISPILSNSATIML